MFILHKLRLFFTYVKKLSRKTVNRKLISIFKGGVKFIDEHFDIQCDNVVHRVYITPVGPVNRKLI